MSERLIPLPLFDLTFFKEEENTESRKKTKVGMGRIGVSGLRIGYTEVVCSLVLSIRFSEGFKIFRYGRSVRSDEHRETAGLDAVKHKAFGSSSLFQFVLLLLFVHTFTFAAYQWPFVVSADHKFFPVLFLFANGAGSAYQVLLTILRRYGMCIHHRVKIRFENVVVPVAQPEPLHTRSTWYQ